MKKFIFVIIVLIIAGGVTSWVIKNSHNQAISPAPVTINNTAMNLSSPAFADNQNIPAKYSCDGEGVNPPLQFSDIPGDAKTLALTIKDPDAPNGLWVHWLVWNIATSTTEIGENSVPEGAVQGQTSSGQKVYGPMCPPSGTHHYIFNLYALDEKLDIPSYSTLDDLTKAMDSHIVEQATLTGLYSR